MLTRTWFPLALVGLFLLRAAGSHPEHSQLVRRPTARSTPGCKTTFRSVITLPCPPVVTILVLLAAPGHHPALFPQAETQAAPGAQHFPVEKEHRGPARQQPVSVAARKHVACAAVADRAVLHLRRCSASAFTAAPAEPALHPDHRQFREHVGHAMSRRAGSNGPRRRR